jgi:ribonucleoside-diphosphate reductase alpha chain
MMAACQPFLSGAISKTVNMPNDATVEDIEQAYMTAWQLDLKAIAIYRDGCKRSQPVSTAMSTASKGDTSSKQVSVVTAVQPQRRRLPSERESITHKFSVAGHDGYITAGKYDDGSLGEIFIKMAKEGSTVAGLMDCFATVVSLALQHGVPLSTMANKLMNTRFDPAGFTGNVAVPRASSIMDYLARWLLLKFDTQNQPEQAQQAEHAATPVQHASPFVVETDAPTCHECGSMMVRSGACHRCPNCGATSGCS